MEGVCSAAAFISYTQLHPVTVVTSSIALKCLRSFQCVAHGICLTIKIISYLYFSLLLALLGPEVDMTRRQQSQHRGKTV